MSGGRPRDVSFPPEQMIELGKEMVQWVKDNKPLHIKQWYSIQKMFTYNQWKTMQVCKEFFPYYEQALNIISIQYIDKTSNIRDSVSHRFLRAYFKDVREQEDEDADRETERKRSIENTKQTNFTIVVPHGLASGANIPTSTIPDPITNSSE